MIESDKIEDRIGIVQLGHQKKSKRDYHRLKRMVKESTEQDLRTRNFLRPEKEELNQTCWSRIRGNNVHRAGASGQKNGMKLEERRNEGKALLSKEVEEKSRGRPRQEEEEEKLLCPKMVKESSLHSCPTSGVIGRRRRRLKNRHSQTANGKMEGPQEEDNKEEG